MTPSSCWAITLIAWLPWSTPCALRMMLGTLQSCLSYYYSLIFCHMFAVKLPHKSWCREFVLSLPLHQKRLAQSDATKQPLAFSDATKLLLFPNTWVKRFTVTSGRYWTKENQRHKGYKKLLWRQKYTTCIYICDVYFKPITEPILRHVIGS